MFAETAYLFRHALLREAAYQLQPPAERAGMHRLALEIMQEALGGSDEALSPFAYELADHARAAGQGAEPPVADAVGRREVELLRLAYLHASRQWQLSVALDCNRRIMASPKAQPIERGRAHCNVVANLMTMGLRTQAEAELAIALPAVRDLYPRDPYRRLLYNGAMLAQARGDDAAFDRYADAMEQDTAATRPNVEYAMALKLRASRLHDLRQHERSIELLRQAESEVRQCNNQPELAGILVNLTLALGDLGREAEAEVLRHECLKLCEMEQEFLKATVLLNNWALARIRANQHEEALALARRVEDFALRAGSAMHHDRTFNSRAIALFSLGRFDEGLALGLRQLELGLAHGAVRGLAAGLENTARCLLALGRAQEAKRLLETTRRRIPEDLRPAADPMLADLGRQITEGNVPL